jgi:putative oxidoreductase
MSKTMDTSNAIARPLAFIARWIDYSQPFLALAIRLWIGLQFFKSGLTKISNWDATLYLFREEYSVPLLPPDLAAFTGTVGELALPLFLWCGLFGRLSALGLFGLNIMAVVSYAHVLYSPGFEAAIAQQYLWGFMLLILVVYGPGTFSLDRLLVGKTPAPAHAF